MQRLLDAIAGLWIVSHPTGAHSYRQVGVLLGIFVGAIFVRFWGLGAVGLHGDEETMAMAVHDILHDGTPHLPSGMLYPRGLAQLYLMAASVALFGETEWALRLPSVLCGLIVIVFAFLIGRRFLRPEWNLAFTAAVAFLPEFIVYSQTARMYIFLVASVAAFLWLVLEWERSGRLAHLVAAVAVMLLGIHFHSLMVFSAPLLLFPPLLRGEFRQLAQALVALVVVAAGFWLINGWVEQQYVGLPSPQAAADIITPLQRSIAALRPQVLPQLAGAAALVAFFAWMVARRMPSVSIRWATAALLAIGLAAQLFLFYHIAAVLLLSGVVLALRHGEQSQGKGATTPLLVLAAASVALLVIHSISLHRLGVGPPQKIVAAMTGLPSLWPYIQTSRFSAIAAAVAALGLAVGLWRFARRGRIEDYWLLLLLGSLLPLMAMGIIRWNVPARYTAGAVLPYLLCAFAALQSLTLWLTARRQVSAGRSAMLVTAALGGLLIVNPIALSRTVNAGYAAYPDHKGAAEFVRSLQLGSNDVVLAEDVLQQTYYLGSVDYWLISWNTARHFVRNVDGRPLDIYTATPVMKSAAEVDALLRQTKGNVYIVGSGENRRDGRRLMRSDGLFELLQSEKVETLFEGRDRFTRVWKVRAPEALADAASSVP